MKRHIILVGLSGAGKTTVGRRAAQALDAPFVDLDELIEARAGKTVARIFAEDGEDAFRDLETESGREVFAGAPGVVALGGGFVADAAKRRTALAAGLVIYLETSPAAAASRLAPSTGRPLLDGQNLPDRLAQLLSQREAAYLESPHRVTTDGLSLVEVAGQVVALARQRGGW